MNDRPRLIWVYWLSVGILLIVLVWVSYTGLLRYDWADSDWVKQAALVKLKTNRFAAPMAEGNIPHATQVYHWYPFYPAVLALFLGLVGQTHAANLFFDLGLNLLAAGIGSWWLMRKTRNGLVGAACLLFCQYLVTVKMGRPEVSTSLAMMLALLAAHRNDHRLSWLTGVFLGCAIASSYPAGVACCAAYSAYLLKREGFLKPVFLRLCKEGIAAVFVVFLVWLYVVYPHPLLAYEALAYNAKLLVPMSLSGFFSDVFGHLNVFLPILGVFCLLFFCIRRERRGCGILTPEEMRVVQATLWGTIGYILTLVLVFRRPQPWYFPPLCHALFPMGAFLLWKLLNFSKVWRTGIFVMFAAVAVGLAMMAGYNRFLIRAMVLPLGWTEQSVTPQRVNAVIDAIIPANSSVGGDGKLITVLGAKFDFISLLWTGSDNWPEYIISPIHPRTLEPTLFGFKGREQEFRLRLGQEYEPVETGLGDPAPCWINDWLKRHGMPDWGYRNCDWYIRVWKRKADSSLFNEGADVSPNAKLFLPQVGVGIHTDK